jgi:uncharacterized protein with beta-barrel porin domain
VASGVCTSAESAGGRAVISSGKFRLLLASTSVAALLIGGGTPSAVAGPCYTGPFPFTNPGALICIDATGQAFTGNITNATGASITAAGAAAPTRTGITVNNSTVTGAIFNAGHITASPASGNGIFVTNNATVTSGISNSGTITAPSADGIFVGGNATAVNATVTIATFGGGITNSGKISAAVDGIAVGGSATKTHASVTISNFAGGIINIGTIAVGVGGVGIFVGGAATQANASIVISTFTGGITNSGTILATAPGKGVRGNGIVVAVSASSVGASAMLSTFGGNISNSGTITVNRTGIAVSVGAGGKTNAGGTATLSTFSASIINSGTITSGRTGIEVVVAGSNGGTATLLTFAGGITNSGAITSTRNGVMVGVSATKAGASATLSTFTGNISNSGTITSTTRTGVAVVVAAASGGTATLSTFGGSITNSGKISAPSANGIVVGVSATKSGASATLSTFAGGITNSGTIVAGRTAIALVVHGSSSGVAKLSTFAGGITNSGTITATRDGISVGVSATKAGSTATLSTFAGGISNSGTITSTTRTGIAVAVHGSSGGSAKLSTFAGNIINSGTISAKSGNGIFVGASATKAGTATLSTFGGSVSNSGTIAVGKTGIFVGVAAKTGGVATLSIFAGNISNIGTISSNSGNGIFVGASASKALSTATLSTFAGNISNSGTITTGKTGIFVGGAAKSGGSATLSLFAGGITNSGRIAAPSATGIAVGGTATGAHSSVTVSNFAGGVSNSGTIIALDNGIFVGGVGGSATKAGGAFTLSTFTGGITNSGFISAATGVGIQVAVTGTGAGSTGTLSTFSGNISNSGTIVVGGTGVGILVGGAATAGGSGTISTFGGSVVNSGNITVKSGIGIFVGGTASGAGSTVTISTFAGGITNSGTISAPTGTGIMVGGKATGATATVTIATFVGGITNTGKITAGSSGIFVGGIVKSGGVVTIANFEGNISNAGTITGRTGIVIGPGVDFVGGAAIVNTGTITGTGGTAINLVNSTNPVTVDINGGAINGNMLGSGLLLGDTLNFTLGAGNTFTYNNNFENFDTVTIFSGTVVLNGTLNSATAVSVAGGTLAGTGTIDPLTVTIGAGGTLSPGTPGGFGTMTIDGNLVFTNASSVYAITIGPGAGNNSATAITGAGDTATLNGATGEVTPKPGHYSGTVYTILTTPAAGDLIGTFAGPVPEGSFTGTMSFVYVNNQDVQLDVTGFSFFAAPAGTNLNQNQQNALTGINNGILNFPANVPLPAQFLALGNLTGAAFANALTQLDGEAATDAEKGAFQLMDQFLDLMLDPFVDGRGGVGTGGSSLGFAPEDQSILPPDVAQAYDSALNKPPQQQTFDQRWSAWGSAFGGASNTQGNSTIGSNNVTAADYGVAAGMDYHVDPDMVFGFALAGGGTNWNLAQTLGGGRSDSFQFGVYGSSHWGPAYLSGALAFANHWFTTNRIALGDQLTANFVGQSYAMRLEGGYRFGLPGNDIGITPYAALQAQDFRTPDYSETDLSGGGLALSYAAMNATDVRTELGARLDERMLFDDMPLVLRGRWAWAHDDVSNPALGAAFQALPGSSFTVNGAAPPANSELGSAAADLHINANWTATVKFDGQFASTAQTYAGTGTLRYTW